MIRLTFDDGGIAVNLAKAPQVTGVLLQRWMTDVVMHMVGAVQKNIGTGGLIGRRTGNLARAIRFEVTPDPLTGTVWPDPDKVPYGSIQEEGGTVIPKHSRFLAIPLEAMLTGNGVARGTARQVKDNPGAFGFASTFIHGGVIFGKVLGAAKASVIPLFALKSSVVIPATHYLSTTLTQETSWIADRLEALTRDVVQVSFGGDAA